MTRAPSRLPLLIALSLLTAGIAVAGSSTTLASEPQVVREEPADEQPPRNLTLEGQLTNASSGEPVPDAEIRVANVWTDEGGDHRSREVLETETDQEGRYALNVSRGHVEMYVDHAGYQLARAEFPIEEGRQVDLPLEPASRDHAVIEGTVTSGGEEPIADAYVRVSAVHDDCEEREDCKRAHATRTTGDEGSAREVETEQGSITVRYEAREDRYVTTRTDEGGRYEARVPEGTYEVRAHAEDHLQADTRVEAQAGASHEADLALTPIPAASVTVEGQVVDDAGDPITHADVSLENQRWGTRNHTTTDEEGRFRLAIQPGYTTLEIRAGEAYRVACAEPEGPTGDGGDARPRDCDPHHERSQAYLPHTRTLQPEVGQTVEVDQRLQPKPQPDTRIDGWVVNASSGEAVPDARLVFVNEETNDWGQARTAQDGSFQIRVDDGYHTVRIHADGYFANATVHEVDGDERLRFQLTPGEPAHGGCCYRVQHEPAHDGAVDAERDSLAEGGDSGNAAGSPSGEQVYAGGPADLGPPPAPDEEGTAPYRDAPGLGAVGLAFAVAAGAALVGRRGT